MRPDPVTSPPAARLTGLDGLRGLAVVLVLGYHLWPDSVPGGFLGVTLFFALSGFLITTLLLRDIERDATIDLRAFWVRRAKRLLPSAVVVIVAIGVTWGTLGWITHELRRDIVWAALQAANWGQVAASQEYGADPTASPLTHFWSLAIESQAYLVLPLVMLAARRSAPRLTILLLCLVMVSAFTVARWWDDPVVTYLATPARIGEISLGAVAAVAVARRPRSTENLSIPAWLGATAVLAFVVSARMFALDDVWFARGALLLAGAIASIAVAAAVTNRRLGRLLDIRPLRWLGTVSYSLYLVHWPLLVGLRRAGVSAAAAPWLTLVVSLPLAALVTRFVEEPIRSGRAMTTPLRRVGALGLAACAIVLTVTVFPAARPTFDARRAAALAAERASATTGTAVPGSSASTPTTDSPTSPVVTGATVAPRSASRIRSVWMSDSTGLSLVLGIPTTERHSITGWFTQMGCPLGRGGEVRSARTGQARWATADKGCAWDEWIAAEFPAGGAEVAVVAFGTWDVAERRIPELGDRWTTIGDPAYDEWLLSEFRTATSSLLAAGAEHVAWLTPVPDIELAPASRFVRHRELIVEHLADFAGRASLLDLAGWLTETGETDRLLPDGAHATFEPDGGTAAEIAERFLFPELERIVDG